MITEEDQVDSLGLEMKPKKMEISSSTKKAREEAYNVSQSNLLNRWPLSQIPSRAQLLQVYYNRFRELLLSTEQFQREIQITNIIRVNKMGSDCFEARWINQTQNLEVFLKKVKLDNLNLRKIENEILYQLYAEKYLPENVIKILGWMPFENDPLYQGVIIMELGSCDLQRVIEKYDLSTQKQNYIDQLVKTVMTLRQINLAHQDIKPDQIIYFKHSNLLKLTGFGSAYYEGSETLSCEQIYSKTQSHYHSSQQSLFLMNQHKFKIKQQDLRRDQCFAYYLFNSYALGLIILKLIFPHASTFEIKKILMALSQAKITKYDIATIFDQKYQNQPTDLEVSKFRQTILDSKLPGLSYQQTLNDSDLKLSFQSKQMQIDKELNIIDVLKLVEYDYQERKCISQLFLDPESNLYQIDKQFGQAFHAELYSLLD